MQQLPLNKWTSIILSALGTDEEPRSVQVKTLRSHYEDLIIEKVFPQYDYILTHPHPNYDALDQKIADAVQEYEKTHDVYVKQFVKVPADTQLPIVICIDLDTIHDDYWQEVVEIISQISYNTELTEFGSYKTFNPNHKKPTFNVMNKRQTFI